MHHDASSAARLVLDNSNLIFDIESRIHALWLLNSQFCDLEPPSIIYKAQYLINKWEEN
jgi:hypothetical protein